MVSKSEKNWFHFFSTIFFQSKKTTLNHGPCTWKLEKEVDFLVFVPMQIIHDCPNTLLTNRLLVVQKWRHAEFHIVCSALVQATPILDEIPFSTINSMWRHLWPTPKQNKFYHQRLAIGTYLVYLRSRLNLCTNSNMIFWSLLKTFKFKNMFCIFCLIGLKPMQNNAVNLSKFVIHSEASLVFAADQGNLQRSVLNYSFKPC